MRPLNDRILIRRDDEETRSKGGLYIPDAAKEKPAKGVVVAVGPKVAFVNEGDRVLFSKYAGNEIVLDDVPHVICREDELLAAGA